MLAEERRMAIFRYIKAKNSAKTEELIRVFDVSGSTIRRDLETLAMKKLIIRTHKGAVLNSTNVETEFLMNYNQHREEKNEIAKKALGLINEGDFIGLSGGTTAYILANEIIKSPLHSLSILTNSINTASLFLESEKNFMLVLAGGTPIRGTYECIGDFTIKMINTYNLDQYFFGVNGLTLQDGISFNNISEAEVSRAFIQRASEAYVIADHSKFNVRKPGRVCSLKKITGIITGSHLSEDRRSRYSKSEIKIL